MVVEKGSRKQQPVLSEADPRGLSTRPCQRRSHGTDARKRYVRGGPAVMVKVLLTSFRVKRRLEHGDGMSVAEFMYPLMQAWDWFKLFQTGTQIQIGGADQFGNLLEGANTVKKLLQVPDLEEQPVQLPEDLRRFETEVFGKSLSDDPMGFTVPLMTTSSGEKFGKSAGNAVWLDRDMTSSFDLYQVTNTVTLH